jgi:hypothetical protein
MGSLLAGVSKSDVKTDPFPHVAIADALDDDTCSRLLAEYPPIEAITKLPKSELPSNKRFGLNASEVIGNETISPLWRDVVEYHASASFLRDLLNVFGDHVQAAYARFEDDVGPFDSLRAGVRNRDSFDSADVLLDAQISVNTPVVGTPDSVRHQHVDAPDKLFAGLFYLRHPEDDSTGGDLELYRFKGNPRGFRGEAPYHTFLETATTIPYKRNMLVMFLNSPKAVHGVTVRSRTDVPRLFLNLIAAVERPLFDLKTFQANLFDRALAGPEIVAKRLKKHATAQ